VPFLAFFWSSSIQILALLQSIPSKFGVTREYPILTVSLTVVFTTSSPFALNQRDNSLRDLVNGRSLMQSLNSSGVIFPSSIRVSSAWLNPITAGFLLDLPIQSLLFEGRP
jgi:hypothetical protein